MKYLIALALIFGLQAHAEQDSSCFSMCIALADDDTECSQRCSYEAESTKPDRDLDYVCITQCTENEASYSTCVEQCN